MTRLVDVAKAAGVSVAVVSRVLNNDPALRARPETCERVLEAARQLQYIPNHAGRALRLARSGALALVVPEVANAIFMDMIRGVEDAADVFGFAVLLGNSERFAESSKLMQRIVGEGRVDGFLLQRGNTTSDELLGRLLDTQTPTVLLNTKHRRRVGSVILDDVAASVAATDHLIKLGHERIMHLTGPPTSDAGSRRAEGFRSAIRRAGLPMSRDSIASTGYTADDGAVAMRAIVARRQRPTAICVANVNVALGALHAANTVGISIPRDLSIIAIHDVWYAGFSSPPLTTVLMPLYDLGRAGVQALVDRLNGRPPANLVVTDPPPQLVLRGSTAPPG